MIRETLKSGKRKLTATQTADIIIIAAPNKLKRGGTVPKNTNSKTIL